MDNAQQVGGDWCDVIAINLFKCQIIDGRDVERVARIYRNACAEQDKAAKEVHHATNEKYAELLMAVAIKHEGETRHETALRYIKEREMDRVGGPCEETRGHNQGLPAMAQEDDNPFVQ